MSQLIIKTKTKEKFDQKAINDPELWKGVNEKARNNYSNRGIPKKKLCNWKETHS